VKDTDRFHAFDALRASALLLGIVLHASMSFLVGFRELRFPIADVSQSLTLEVFFFVVHMFRMMLFFLVAGFFARLLMQRLGTGGFVKNRLRRVGLPLLIFYPLLLPLVVLPIIWAAKQQGMPPGQGGPAGLPQGIPWFHLWFLYLLVVMYALLLVLRALGTRLDAHGRVRGLADAALRAALSWRVAPLVLGLPIAVVLYLTPSWIQMGGIPAPIAGFIPNAPGLLAYGSAFLVGWWIHRQPSLFALLSRDWKLYLSIAVVATVIAMTLTDVRSHFTPLVMSMEKRALYAFVYLLGVWCWVLGLTGAALTGCTAPSARWRYLSDASYWMYLVHVPIVWALQAWMMRWPLHWTVKFALILGVAGALLLASYHYLVRSTFLGKLLNGRKYPRSLPLTPATT
jgi:fucose 4-O-acetylase-like acetyltransferase